MTTAHRPTFDPARGKEALRGPAYHQRLLPAHTHLKHRQLGQGGDADAGKRDLRAELLKAEAAVKARKAGRDVAHVADEDESSHGVKRKLIETNKEVTGYAEMSIGDAEADSEEDAEAKRRRLILEDAREIDADSESGSDDSSDDESSDEDEDDEDGEAELLRELAKIKAERAAQRAAEEAAQAQKDAEQREKDIALGNPLLNKQDFGIKRRWDDDVVFRNQARGTEDKGKGKEFVNDLLRSDFHKRFMSKYVR